MREVRLEDIGYILSGLVIVVFAFVAFVALVNAWPYVVGFVRAVALRYFNADSWRAFLDNVADLGGGSVKRSPDSAPITSSTATGTTPPIPVSPDTVLPDMYQAIPAIPPSPSATSNRDAGHNLDGISDEELFTFLALRRRGDGWQFSANALAAAFGGDRNERLKQIAKLRSGAPPRKDTPADRAPISGRTLPSDAKFHSDLELAEA